jgi:hypothetical protein
MLELDARDTTELEFWRAAFQSFVTAKSKAEAIEALSGALRSEKEMPHIFRRVLADMLETGGVRGTWYPAWKLAVVLREDVTETKIRLDSWAAYSEVQELIDKGMKPTPACREVAARRNKLQRTIEKAYEKHNAEMQKIMGEARERVVPVIERSKLPAKAWRRTKPGTKKRRRKSS